MSMSLRSSFAMWIQYSCGSLMTTQIRAAAVSHQRNENRVVDQRERTAS